MLLKHFPLVFVFASIVSSQVSFKNISQYINQTVESLGFLPVKQSDVTFQLFTRNNTQTYVPLTIGQLGSAPFIRKNQVFAIITHGYMNNASSAWMLDMKFAYLHKYDYNVILVDWSKPAKLAYPMSAASTKAVGTFVGQLVYDLWKTFNVNVSAQIHLLGHSLGAHVCGFAGNYVQKYKVSVGRISGMDPAGPLFFMASKSNRLDASDAAFVDVIHTDSLFYGYILPLGHVDFYPNGGIAPQPGCQSLNPAKEIIDGCSHTRSHQLYVESIAAPVFNATACPNALMYLWKLCTGNRTNVMGELADPSRPGIYQLITNSVSPYALASNIH